MLQLLSPLPFTSILLEEFEGVVDRLYVYACTINRTFVHYKLSSSLYFCKHRVRVLCCYKSRSPLWCCCCCQDKMLFYH